MKEQYIDYLLHSCAPSCLSQKNVIRHFRNAPKSAIKHVSVLLLGTCFQVKKKKIIKKKTYIYIDRYITSSYTLGLHFCKSVTKKKAPKPTTTNKKTGILTSRI